MKNELKDLIERLERIFPEMELHTDSYEFNDGEDCCPPTTMDWYEFINKLYENGLVIKNIKDIK